MRGLDLLKSLQICNRARQFHASPAMITPRRQIQLTHRRPHQALTLLLQPAELPDLPDAHIRIADDVRRSAVIRYPIFGVPEAGLFLALQQPEQLSIVGQAGSYVGCFLPSAI
jgi:hypothetical protein